MKLSIIPSDNAVVIDNYAIHDLELEIDSNIHAVQWDGDSGHIEYVKHSKPIKVIDNLDAFQHIIFMFEKEKVILDA